MKHILGTCTRCKKANCQLTIIDEVDHVCDECLDTFYTQCDDCGEYWEDSYVEFFVTADDRLICEHCRENYDDDEIVDDE